MECKAQYSILGSDNIFAKVGFDPCMISVLEIVISVCVFAVLVFSIHHAASMIFTWYRWFNLKISTQRYDHVDDSGSDPAALENSGNVGNVTT